MAVVKRAGGPARRPRPGRWTPVFLRFCVRVVCCGALLGALPAPAHAQEVIDRILAVVGGEVITLSDVRSARALGRVEVGDAADPVRATLDHLIDRALILDEADRFAPPEPPAASVDTALAAAVARFESRAALDRLLEGLGVDLAFVREWLRQDLRIRAYLNQRFTADTEQQQRQLVDEWVQSLRRRVDVVDLYAELNGRARGTGTPARD